MKVWNLTDVETASLRQKGLVRRTIVVGPALLAPGQSREVDPSRIDAVRPGLQELVAAGALALGQPPAPYVVAKAKGG